MNMLNPKIIVLSRNYSTGLGVIRSLGAAGYSVDLVASVKKNGSSIIASSSKYVQRSIEVLSPQIQQDMGENLIQTLLDWCEHTEEKQILFPTDDFTTSVIDRYRQRLEPFFLMPYIAKDDCSMVQLMDKTLQANIARKFGLETPKEWQLSLKNEIFIPKDLVYPCFVKPIQSISGHKTEMAMCRNTAELMRHLKKIQSVHSDRAVLVQEFLHIEKEYDLSGVCIDQDIIIPAVIEKTKIAQYERGVTLSGKMMPKEVLGEAMQKIVEFMKQFHYVGMFDMELNLCNGKLYFNEVNLRSGGPNYAYYLSGVNLPNIFVKALLGLKYSEESDKIQTFGKSFVYEKVAWEDYIHGHMSKAELEKCLKETDYKLLDDAEDKEPARIFEKRIRLSAMKNRLKKLIKKNDG